VRKTKLKDVADHAGVSLTTASMALSGTGRLSQETRERVLSSARAVGYQKKEDLSKFIEKIRTIGILLNIDEEWDFIYHFIRPIIQEFEKTVSPFGYNTSLIPISRNESSAEIYGKIIHAGCAAVVTLHYGNGELFERLEREGIPAILVMNGNFQDRYYSVCVDDFQGAYEGALHLIRHGHRRIGYIDTERLDLPQLLVDRFIGFRKAMDEYNLPFSDEMRIRYTIGRIGEFSKRIEGLMARDPSITAFFVLDDDLAARVIVALQRIHRKVPEDISIIAPGDVLDYSLPHIPQITTMRIDTAYMGKITGQMMLNRITHNPQDIHVLKVKQQLVKRGSCRTEGLDAPREKDPEQR
jgi:LacI family transcriptional regulator